MKRTLVPMLLVASLGCLLVGSLAWSKSAMARYMVISPHSPEECLKAMDDIAAEGPKVLEQFSFGCMSGDHTAYAMVMASSEQEALKLVPESIRDKAKAIKVSKLTAADIKKFHEMHH